MDIPQDNSFKALIRGRGAVSGMLFGAAYGLIARAVGSPKVNDTLGEVFFVMSLAFLFIVPTVIGVITSNAARAPSAAYRLFAPWIPILLLMGAAAVIGWE